jgi:renalase
LATRRLEALTFDHGVQYFTIQDPRFELLVRKWETDGIVADWGGRTVALDARGLADEVEHVARFVGMPNMQAVAIHMARGLDLRLKAEVTNLQRRAGRWTLQGPEGELDDGGFDLVVLALPSPLAVQLLQDVSPLTQRVASVSWDSCWAAMLALARPSGIDFDAAFINDDPILGWIARESSKPGRKRQRGAAETWILHAHPAWSGTYLGMEPGDASRWMQRAFAARVGRPLMQAAAAAHGWRLALPVNPLPEAFLFDASQAIGLAGDWCGGPRVEGAYLSGVALARAIAS